MAAMNKSLAQINKSQDGEQSDQEAFGSTRCSRAERAEFYFDPLCQLAPARQWLGLFPSMAANATTERAVFAALRPPQTEGKCHEYLTEAASDRGAFGRHTDVGRCGPESGHYHARR